ncbi:MAG: hypothetical protein JWN35_3836 [Frankiales bacterium]|nr:hypothetical protein [Frankiales bacterium]
MPPAEALAAHLVTFARVLREGGIETGPGRVVDALRGLDCVDLTQREDVYWTLRQTLVSRVEDLGPFDRAFAVWFDRAEVPGRDCPEDSDEVELVAANAQLAAEGGDEDDDETGSAGWSADELLRRKDFAAMSPEEFARARVLMTAARACRPMRRSRRLSSHHRGPELDIRAMLRSALDTDGEVVGRRFRRRQVVPRRIVFLCDVSGSMEIYARALLLFAYAVAGAGRDVETFTFGTRLTRLTRDLRSRDPERALAATTARIPDWSGGTRIGLSLKAFNDEWGRRATTRGAVVVIISDGWERDDPGLVSREMHRLARTAYAVIWVNPLKGNPDYEPLAGGMRAALPSVDRFLSGHNLESLGAVAEVIGGIESRHGG